MSEPIYMLSTEVMQDDICKLAAQSQWPRPTWEMAKFIITKRPPEEWDPLWKCIKEASVLVNPERMAHVLIDLLNSR